MLWYGNRTRKFSEGVQKNSWKLDYHERGVAQTPPGTLREKIESGERQLGGMVEFHEGGKKRGNW